MMVVVDKSMSLSEVCAYLGVCRQTLMQWVKDGDFPAPTKVGPRLLKWHPGDVERALRSKLAKSVCPRCPGTEHGAAANYCTQCGSKLQKTVPTI